MKICINGDTLSNNSVYGYYPNDIKALTTKGNANYELIHGKLTIVDKSGKRKFKTINLTTSFLDGDSIVNYILPNNKLLFEVSRLKHTITGDTLHVNSFFIVKMDSMLLYKPDAELELLVNGGVAYKHTGIMVNAISSMAITGYDAKQLDTTQVELILARGSRIVRCALFANVKSYTETIRTHEGLAYPGDRLILIFSFKDQERKKTFVIPIGE